MGTVCSPILNINNPIRYFTNVTIIIYNVITEGRAIDLQKGSHSIRGQWDHQVTGAALIIVLIRSYAEYHTTTPDDETVDFGEWCKQMKSDHLQFNYWHKLLKLHVLMFLKSRREEPFVLYVE